MGEAAWVSRTGDFRTREQHGLIGRPNYLYGMLRAADCAKYFGKTSVTAIEFGVASGAGLVNMVDLAELITKETGVKFRIVGFDTGAGLPTIEGYKDHPEIWNPGDFAMEDRPALLKSSMVGRTLFGATVLRRLSSLLTRSALPHQSGSSRSMSIFILPLSRR